jgi:hypothetical protein
MRLDEDLSCAELVEIVTEYFEGALPTSHQLRFEEHVIFCEGCATHLLQMKETIRVVGVLTEDDVPDQAADELLAAFRGWKRG